LKNLLGLILSALLFLGLAVPSGGAVHAEVSEPETLALLHAHATCSAASGTLASALITWQPIEVECPVCQTKNIFLEWVSYGNYIYLYPSKYQLIFWPYTDSPAWYSCKKCRLTTFMGDFAKIPREKIPALREALKNANLPPQKARSKEDSMVHPPYVELPVSARLIVAEKVYRTLGQTNDEFWNHFYRVLGYHFAAEQKPSEADEARRQSLTLIERLLADKANEGRRKELLYVAGAMKHFLRDDAGALRAFEEAKKLTYADKDSKPEDNKGYDEYLSKLMDEYIEMLGKGEGPRTKKAAIDH
jgi:hypothetical protein